MERVGRGEKPLVKKVDVFDTTGYGEVGSRLPRSYGKVNKLSQAVARFADRLTPEDKAAAGPATERFLSACGRLFQAVQRHYRGRPANADDSAPAFKFNEWRDWSSTPDGELLVPKVVQGVACGTSFLEKTVNDLGRLPQMPADRQFWPSRLQAHGVLVQLFKMIRALLRTTEVLAGRAAVTRVVTHTGPDGEAVAAAWLAERFLFAGRTVEVAFVDYAHDWASGPPADCVVDLGGLHAPAAGLFDHKEPASAARHDSCATRLVWDHLVQLGHPVGHLKSLVGVGHAGDSARERGRLKSEYTESRRSGFHKSFKDAKSAHPADDAVVYRAVRRWLDRHHASLATPRG